MEDQRLSVQGLYPWGVCWDVPKSISGPNSRTAGAPAKSATEDGNANAKTMQRQQCSIQQVSCNKQKDQEETLKSSPLTHIMPVSRRLLVLR